MLCPRFHRMHLGRRLALGGGRFRSVLGLALRSAVSVPVFFDQVPSGCARTQSGVLSAERPEVHTYLFGCSLPSAIVTAAHDAPPYSKALPLPWMTTPKLTLTPTEINFRSLPGLRHLHRRASRASPARAEGGPAGPPRQACLITLAGMYAWSFVTPLTEAARCSRKDKGGKANWGIANLCGSRNMSSLIV